MSNNVKRETAATITAAIDRAIRTETALSSATVDRFADYVDGTDAIVARMAYAVRLRGIGDMDGNASLASFADRIGRKRSSMSQYATMVGWLVESSTPVTAVTFGYARTLYGRGKTVKPMVEARLAEIADLATDADRVKVWEAMRDTFVATKPADTDTDDTTTGEDTDDNREARVNVPAPTMTRQEWIDTLDALATAAVLLSDASDSERAHISDALATIAARVGETVSA
jgi:hypothetical protein